MRLVSETTDRQAQPPGEYEVNDATWAFLLPGDPLRMPDFERRRLSDEEDGTAYLDTASLFVAASKYSYATLLLDAAISYHRALWASSETTVSLTQQRDSLRTFLALHVDSLP